MIGRRAFLRAASFFPLSLRPQPAYLDLAGELAAAGARGGGEVIVSSDTISIGKTLVVPAKVTLRIERSATLKAVANVDVVEVRIGGKLTGGGAIDARLPGYSKAAILVRGVPQGAGNDHTLIDDLIIRGTRSAGCSGILFHALPGMRITWVKTKNLDVLDAYYGVRILVDGTGPKRAWVNANQFEVDVQRPVRAFVVETLGSRARSDGNWIRGQIQTNPGIERVVYCDGNYNRFDLFAWDWYGAGSETAVEFSPRSSYNVVAIPSILKKNFVDQGRNNVSMVRER